MKNFLGALYVAIGAASYGILATIVKIANKNGFSVSSLTFLQFSIGFIVFYIISLFVTNSSPLKTKVRLSTFGTSLGLTSCFYYLSIQSLPVSVGIILLMQAIWLSVLLEIILYKKIKLEKVGGAFMVIIGTLLAVNITELNYSVNLLGILYGFLSAVSYTVAIYASNNVELDISDVIRSKYLVLGGFVIVVLFWNTNIIRDTNILNINLWSYGIVLAIFGTLIPPFFFNKGFPLTGIGLGSIIASLEIPISVISAYIFLNEKITITQWIGILTIIISVGVINLRNLFQQNKHKTT